MCIMKQLDEQEVSRVVLYAYNNDYEPGECIKLLSSKGSHSESVRSVSRRYSEIAIGLVAGERFFLDHGMWHDRLTGQHMYTEDMYYEKYRDGLAIGRDEVLSKEWSDTQRVIFLMQHVEGFTTLAQDRHEYALQVADDNGRDEPNEDDYLNGFRRMCDDAKGTV